MSIIESLKRTRYFVGRVLTIDDFECEQTYFLDRARRHNRFMHGWGVVTGLEVRMTGPDEVRVNSGFAVDCAGNDIVVATPACAKIISAKTKLFVALSYKEVEESMTPTPGADTQASIICECFELKLLETNPSLGHRGIGPGTPGCGRAHPLCLAFLTKGRKGWKLARVKSGR
jgi:hypothetical protein